MSQRVRASASLAGAGMPVWAVLALVAGATACGSGDQLSLVEAFPVAERESPFSDLALLEGWSVGFASATVWGTGDQSILRFRAQRLVDAELVADAHAFGFAGAPRQLVDAELNGRWLGRRSVGRDWEPLRWELPRSRLLPGENRIVLRYAYARVPREVIPGSSDVRELAVDWRDLRVQRGGNAPRVDGRALVLPVGETLHYFARTGPGARLEAAGLEARGGTIRLRLVVTQDSGFRRGRLVAADSGRIHEPLGLGGGGGVVRVSVSAEGDQGELAIESPRLSWDTDTQHASQVQPPGAPPRNVLLYVVDTLRADRVAAYGGSGAVTPHLDALAEESLVFTAMRAESSWTRPAVASLMTGLSMPTHGIGLGGDALSERAETLAERLRAAGFRTAGFTTNIQTTAEYGLAQGFEVYEYLPESEDRPDYVAGARELHDRALRWLDQERTPEEPFFLYLHATDPHSPYVASTDEGRHRAAVPDPGVGSLASLEHIDELPEAEARGLAPTLALLYDANAWEWDRELGSLLAALRQRGLLDTTLLVLVSDHGEEFFEHGGWQHGKTLYEEQLRAVLVLRFPEGRGERSPRLARQRDVLPSMLDALGLGSVAVEGRSLLSGPVGDRFASAHVVANGTLESVFWRDAKLIRSLDPGEVREELYDTRSDPRETRDLADQRPILAGFLRTALFLERARRMTPLPREFVAPDAEHTRALRALGYVE